MEKFIPTIIGIVLILCGVVELYLIYRYSQNIKKLKNQSPAAPFAIWSGLIFGLFFIVGPIIAMAGGLKNMNQMASIVGGILFWIAAIFSLARAEKIRKKLKAENKPLSSSPQAVATYVIVIAAVISGLIAIF